MATPSQHSKEQPCRKLRKKDYQISVLVVIFYSAAGLTAGQPLKRVKMLDFLKLINPPPNKKPWRTLSITVQDFDAVDSNVLSHICCTYNHNYFRSSCTYRTAPWRIEQSIRLRESSVPYQGLASPSPPSWRVKLVRGRAQFLNQLVYEVPKIKISRDIKFAYGIFPT